MLNTDDRPVLSFRLTRQVLEHRLPPDLFEPATGE
jgi:hypothetical protein